MKQNIILILIVSLFIQQSIQTACTGNTVTVAGASDDGGVTGACNSCPDGYYTSDQTSCVKCEAGLIGKGIQALTGATKDVFCSKCQTGYSSISGTISQGTCDQCDDGYYSSDNSTCVPCEAGWTGNGIFPLANGGAAKATACSQCQTGYSSISGTTSQGTCDQCDDGYFSSDNTNCTPCSAGYYGRGILPIAGGKAANNLACAQCPANTTSQQGTTSTELCSCNDGYFSSDNATCKQCPANYIGLGSFPMGNGAAIQSIACKACDDNGTSNAGTPSTGSCTASTINGILLKFSISFLLLIGFAI